MDYLSILSVTSLEYTQVDACGQWRDCLSCVADSGCAYCTSLNKCIQGNWFGVVNKTMDYCPVTDYYYKQCQFSSLPLGIMASIVLFLLLILVLIGLCYLFCCCSCCCRSDQDEEERQVLLGGDRSRYLRRSSTYYQYNKSIPTAASQFQHQPHPPQQRQYQHHHLPSTSLASPKSPKLSAAPSMNHHHRYSAVGNDALAAPDNWETRRSHLLKKYARDPALPPSPTTSTPPSSSMPHH